MAMSGHCLDKGVGMDRLVSAAIIYSPYSLLIYINVTLNDLA